MWSDKSLSRSRRAEVIGYWPMEHSADRKLVNNVPPSSVNIFFLTNCHTTDGFLVATPFKHLRTSAIKSMGTLAENSLLRRMEKRGLMRAAPSNSDISSVK